MARKRAAGSHTSAINAFARDAHSLEVLKQALAGRQATVLRGGVIQARARLREARAPALVVVDLDESPLLAAQAVEMLASVCAPTTPFVAIGSRSDATMFQALLAAGCTSYLAKPLKVGAVRAVISELLDGPVEERTRAGRWILICGTSGAGQRTFGDTLAFDIVAGGTSVIVVDAHPLGARGWSPRETGDLAQALALIRTVQHESATLAFSTLYDTLSEAGAGGAGMHDATLDTIGKADGATQRLAMLDTVCRWPLSRWGQLGFLGGAADTPPGAAADWIALFDHLADQVEVVLVTGITDRQLMAALGREADARILITERTLLALAPTVRLLAAFTPRPCTIVTSAVRGPHQLSDGDMKLALAGRTVNAHLPAASLERSRDTPGGVLLAQGRAYEKALRTVRDIVIDQPLIDQPLPETD